VISDPCEVMGNVVAAEASLLQASADSDVVLDAWAISEAELHRSRLPDRLIAARGTSIRVHLRNETCQGAVLEVGDEILVLESRSDITAVMVSSIVSIDGLPHALRPETYAPQRVSITWASLLRQWLGAASVRLALVDGCCLRARIESVGSDHLDVRDADDARVVIALAAITSATISR